MWVCCRGLRNSHVQSKWIIHHQSKGTNSKISLIRESCLQFFYILIAIKCFLLGNKSPAAIPDRHAFKTVSNFCDGAFFGKYLTAKSPKQASVWKGYLRLVPGKKLSIILFPGAYSLGAYFQIFCSKSCMAQIYPIVCFTKN